MSFGGWAAIEGIIGRLREIADADRADWLRLAHQIEELNPVKAGSPAGQELQLMASAAKRLAVQIPHSDVINETELRGVAQALANVLKNGMDACQAQIAERNRPYYLRGDR